MGGDIKVGGERKESGYQYIGEGEEEGKKEKGKERWWEGEGVKGKWVGVWGKEIKEGGNW